MPGINNLSVFLSTLNKIRAHTIVKIRDDKTYTVQGSKKKEAKLSIKTV